MSGPCADCGGPDYQTLLARIAELEAMGTSESGRLSSLLVTERAYIAVLEADKETADLCIEHLSLDNERMEAELAALKARRCETCRHYATNDYGYYCESADTPWFEEQPPPNYSCIHWAERTAP